MSEIIQFPADRRKGLAVLAEQYLIDATPVAIQDFDEIVFGAMYTTDPVEGSFLARRLAQVAPALRQEFARLLFELEVYANEQLAQEMMHPVYGRPRDTIFATADTTQISVFGRGAHRRLRVSDTTGESPVITLVYREGTEENSLLARHHDNRAAFEADETTEILSEGQEVDARRLRRVIELTQQLLQKVRSEPIKGFDEDLTAPL